MIYSNIEFLILWIAAWILYAWTQNKSFRQLILILASQLFFLWAGFVDYLIFFAITFICWYATVLGIKHGSWKKTAIFIGILTLAVHLFYWKYFTWIWGSGLGLFHRTDALLMPQYAIPVGISFYTLQAIAYLIDFSRGKAPLLSFWDFLLFKSFFPQLVAGPICRSHQILPQLKELAPLQFKDIGIGLLLFSIGFFKKLALADNLEPFVSMIFSSPEKFNGTTLFVGALAFTAQIWCDFSGYTDMGRGIARTFGIKLPENFLSPYFAKSPSEFWQRWHITLSQWIRDYIYIPLGGSQGSRIRVFAVAIVTMIISGLWHGAAWNFLLWGAYHGLLLVGERLLRQIKRPSSVLFAPFYNSSLQVLAMFGLTVFGWIIFRIQSLSDLYSYLFLSTEKAYSIDSVNLGFPLAVIATAAVIHGASYYSLAQREYPIISILRKGARYYNLHGLGASRNLAYVCLSLVIFMLGLYFRSGPTSASFIYFQF